MVVLMQFGINNVVLKNIESIRTFITDLIEKFIYPEEETEEETEVPEAEV